jgi:hypothetical protein
MNAMRKLIVLLLLSVPAFGQTSWKFAVAGDSRNCGDVVMPVIANGVKSSAAAFYWHLGDFRALAGFDQDMKPAGDKPPLTIITYNRTAWPDFLRNQIAPFAPVPVYLGIGNHELYFRTRADYIAQFGDWLTAPAVRNQRLADDPNDHTLRTWYHFIQGGVDFVTLDNASPEQFDDAQLAWIKRVLDADAKNPDVKSVVLGMHAALPHSLGCDHSMNESAAGEASGVLVYHQLLEFREATQKNVYVIASHSHFLLRDVYDSPYWHAHGGVLPGMIVGTAGAVRYRLPDTALTFPPERARTDVYGFLLGNVDASGAITFDFQEASRADVPADVVNRVGAETVDWCFAQNRDLSPRSSEPRARADAPCGGTGAH